MVIKSYSVTLESNIVEPAKKIMDSKGQKLSPIINLFLKDWLKEQNTEEESNGNVR